MIAGILLSMAVPNFREFLQNLNIETETGRLIKDIQLARDEAMKQGRPVTICRSEKPGAVPQSTDTASSGDLTCGGGTSGDWTTGWFVFMDLDGDGEFDYPDDILVGVSQAVKSTDLNAFSNSEGEDFLQFSPDGSTNANDNIVRFSICDDRGKDYGELIEVPPLGRSRLANAVGNCTNGS